MPAYESHGKTGPRSGLKGGDSKDPGDLIASILETSDFSGHANQSLLKAIKEELRSQLPRSLCHINETPQKNSYDLVINGNVSISIFSQFAGTEAALVSRNHQDEKIQHSINIAHEIPDHHLDRWRVMQSKYGSSTGGGNRSIFITVSEPQSQSPELFSADSLSQDYNRLFLQLLFLGILCAAIFWAWYLLTVGAPSIAAPYW